MKRLLFSFVICAGFLTACVDKNEEVDEETKPEWLGGSIYEELQNADQTKLTGTFSTYLRLVDDLGYGEVLSRTGSKTVFPANDEAFERFFNSDNSFGVRSYDDLTDSQKKMLLYYSMLDNALLTSMLSGVSNSGGTVDKGMSIKHTTTLSVTDSLQSILLPSQYYANNSEWTRFDKSGINVVGDATQPMMVHFTRDYMLTNGLTTTGSGSDFSIITGEEYDGRSTYIFRNKVINGDVTCQNGYVHQVQDVIDPPGNMAQLLRKTAETSLFSRMLDRYAVPVYNGSVTTSYLDWAEQNNVAYRPDSIFEIRYLSSNSQGSVFNNSNKAGTESMLPFDPGWNEYYISSNNTYADHVTDIAAMFVPDDDAVKDYFINGTGKAILDEYGTLKTTGVPVSEENLIENIDMIPQSIITPILSNLMKESFAMSVPSMFASITDDVGDFMGMKLDYVKQLADGTYDIKIANNGVIYVLNTMIAPTSYQAVSSPAKFKSELSTIGFVINNSSSDALTLNLDYYAYLQTMTSNFALFLPTDEAFRIGYVDPASLKHEQPIAVKYYRIAKSPYLAASTWEYDPVTNTVGDSIGVMATTGTELEAIRAQLTDLINYCTVVLNSSDNSQSSLSENNFYKTKHGGAIKVSGDRVGGTVAGGMQLYDGMPASTLLDKSTAKNGTSYQVDRLIHGPVQSVYAVLQSTPQFSEFFDFCQGFDNDNLMEWAGISAEQDPNTKITPIDAYKVFYSNDNKCLDNNIKFFNTYNYTVYAPNNDAMAKAYKQGLPTWDEVRALWDEGANESEADKAAAKAKIDIMRQFARYHFQKNSIYADKQVEGGSYTTFLTDDLGISQKIDVSGGDCKLVVTDLGGQAHTIQASATGDPIDSKVVNRMTRDFVLNDVRTKASYMTTSSFAVVHEITSPFYFNASGDFSKGFVSDASSAKKH